MRVGMVTACYKPVINGVTRMISLYKQRLESLGHEVTVFTLGDPDPAGEEPGVIRSPALPIGDNGYYVSIRYTRAAQELMRQMDIIHCHHLFMSVEMAHRYGRCPIVYTNHTRYDLYTGSVIPIPQPAADALMRQIWPDITDLADVVITPSESVRQVMRDFGVRQPIEVIENGVDLTLFRRSDQPKHKMELDIPESDIVLIYVGRLSAEKSLDHLLEQFAIALDIVPNMRLMLVGGGPMGAELSQMASEMGITQRVTLTGATDYIRVADYLAAADIFATASITEVHPLTVIEAMAAGLPVVAIASPGLIDTVKSGESGFLVKRPEGGLAAAMVALALDKERRQKMGQQARAASERFDIRNTVARTMDLYQRLQATRPDLLRKREHGRWIRQRERLQPVAKQLDRLLRPAERFGTGTLKWLGGEVKENQGDRR